MVRPRPDALRPQLLTLVDSSCPYGRRRAWSTRRALSPPRGGRNASQVAPRACRARCARLPTRRKQRRAGSRSRTASNLQATHASCATLCMRLHQRDPTNAARVPQPCRSSCFNVWIDILHAADRLLHHRWTRRAARLDQSSPILCARGPAATLHLRSLGQLASL